MPTAAELAWAAKFTEGEIIGDTTHIFANNAVINTVVSGNVAAPVNRGGAQKARFVLEVLNPSPNTGITVRVRLIENTQQLGGAPHYPQVAFLQVPLSTPEGLTAVFEAPQNADGFRIDISNDVALGAAGGFTTFARIRRE